MSLIGFVKRLFGRKPRQYKRQNGTISATPICWSNECEGEPRYRIENPSEEDGSEVLMCRRCVGV